VGSVAELARKAGVIITGAVNGNQRTYTEAGGRKIGHSKDDPEWVWIDTYSAIKTPAINAVFLCYSERCLRS
jgi:hypothetical protein